MSQQTNLASLNLDKRGISIMIGYVLLITTAVVMGAITYKWIITYVPTDPLECEDGSSLFIKESLCDNSNAELHLNLTISNNGRFNLDGYYIRGSTSAEQEIATRDIASFGNSSSPAGFILFTTDGGELEPGEEASNNFIFDNTIPDLTLIEIIPLRYQVEDNKKRLLVCGDAKVKEIISCKTP